MSEESPKEFVSYADVFSDIMDALENLSDAKVATIHNQLCKHRQIAATNTPAKFKVLTNLRESNQ